MEIPSKAFLGGSIHRIREFELEKVNLADEFDILQIVGEGWFGKILLVEHKATDTEMVLKALPKPYTALRDFYREFHYGLHLGAHRNIITTYDVAFETAGFYVFSQEYAPLGDLTSNVSETGIGELHTKRVAKQLAAALEHLHTRDLVHRDVKLDNVLVFKSDFSRIKLCDFGETRRAGSVVLRRNEWLPYAPPEVLQVDNDGSYVTHTSHDVWQFAIVVFVCLTGCLPWQKAAQDDPRYSRYLSWHSSTISLKRQPKLFKLVSSKAQKLFKKYLEPRPERRPAGLAEVHRFLDDRWMSKGGIEKTNEAATEEEGLCPSMYSFHSSPEEKNKLLFTLTQYGIETTVDRCAKKDRIRQWIQTSVIEEENEDEEQQTEEGLKIRDNQTGPPGERVEGRGPISYTKVRKRERRMSTMSIKKPEAEYLPPIDPRIPLEGQMTRRRSSVIIKNGNAKIAPETKEPAQKTNGILKPVEKPKEPILSFNIHSALPFQNMAIKESHDSVTSNDSANTIRHKINVQIPQNELYSCSLSPKLPPREKKQLTFAPTERKVANGARDSPVNRRPNGTRNKSSSSNSYES